MYYEKRILAFVDILGFKDKVQKSLDSEKVADKLHNALKRILALKTQNDVGPMPMKNEGVEVTTFSDSAVISYPASDPDNLFYLIIDLIHLQLDLARNDVLLRGGLTIGQAYHDGSIVYGPAMNEAYELESKIATAPRIIVDKKAVDAYRTHFAEDETALQDIDNLLRQDIDGCFFIDMLRQDQELTDCGTEYFAWLEELRDVIIEGLKNENLRVRTKYEWLRTYYNEVVTDEKAYYPVPNDCLFDEKNEFRNSYADLKIE